VVLRLYLAVCLGDGENIKIRESEVEVEIHGEEGKYEIQCLLFALQQAGLKLLLDDVDQIRHVLLLLDALHFLFSLFLAIVDRGAYKSLNMASKK
jgi:hypothetical protein